MDKLQKGVSMAKAEAFNKIVKVLKLWEGRRETIIEIDRIIVDTLKSIDGIKEKFKVDK